FENTGNRVKIHHTTLAARAAGRRSRTTIAQSQEWLLPEETTLIIDHITQCANQGFPLSHRRLKENVDQILRAQLDNDFVDGGVGKRWTQRFVERHSDKL
ncbi:hypothetical protein FA15DRAFT_551710, partial [Coprinopsis marcescibilis]